MKQEDKQYEKWLTEVKSNQPLPSSTEYPGSHRKGNGESFS